MIKAIIVEDQQNSTDELLYELSQINHQLKIVATCKNVTEAFQKISELKPNLVFLDIQLGQNTAFDLLDLFDDVFFKTIFTTGHNEFAIKAIKYNAFDYILKPINRLELLKAIQKVEISNYSQVRYHSLGEQISTQTLSNKIALNIGREIVLVNVNEIVYCEADGHYTKVFTLQNIKYFVSQSIKDFEYLLKDKSFYRSHKSFLINIDHIKKYSQKQEGYIIMQNDIKIPISQRKKNHFIKIMNTKFNR